MKGSIWGWFATVVDYRSVGFSTWHGTLGCFPTKWIRLYIDFSAGNYLGIIAFGVFHARLCASPHTSISRHHVDSDATGHTKLCICWEGPRMRIRCTYIAPALGGSPPSEQKLLEAHSVLHPPSHRQFRRTAPFNHSTLTFLFPVYHIPERIGTTHRSAIMMGPEPENNQTKLAFTSCCRFGRLAPLKAYGVPEEENRHLDVHVDPILLQEQVSRCTTCRQALLSFSLLTARPW